MVWPWFKFVYTKVNQDQMPSDTFRFSTPAFYSISVSGVIKTGIKDHIMTYFKGEPEFHEYENSSYVSGQLKDQAALSGLLNALYNQRYIILTVQRIENEIDIIK